MAKKYHCPFKLGTPVVFEPLNFNPKFWDTLFIMIIGAYPPTINYNKQEHLNIEKGFISTMSNLRYTLPCSFCRESYKKFYNQLPIKQFSQGRITMMYWLYLMKDLVNKKLITQELDYLTDLHKNYRTNKINIIKYTSKSKGCFTTSPSPKFMEVLEKYSALRAICNKKLKKCIAQ